MQYPVRWEIESVQVPPVPGEKVHPQTDVGHHTPVPSPSLSIFSTESEIGDTMAEGLGGVTEGPTEWRR